MAENELAEGVGVASINMTSGRLQSALIERAMSDAVFMCNAAGISTEDKNSPIIRECMMAAREAVRTDTDVAEAVAAVLRTTRVEP